jgi:hypothetical protein
MEQAHSMTEPHIEALVLRLLIAAVNRDEYDFAQAVDDTLTCYCRASDVICAISAGSWSGGRKRLYLRNQSQSFPHSPIFLWAIVGKMWARPANMRHIGCTSLAYSWAVLSAPDFNRNAT